MDYDSVVNTVAATGTVIALMFGIRAYSVAQHANRLAKEQGRKTFELELLRELNALTESTSTALQFASLRRGHENANAIGARLGMLPQEELKLWRMVVSSGFASRDVLEQYVIDKLPEATPVPEDSPANREAFFDYSIAVLLRDELLKAIRARMS